MTNKPVKAKKPESASTRSRPLSKIGGRELVEVDSIIEEILEEAPSRLLQTIITRIRKRLIGSGKFTEEEFSYICDKISSTSISNVILKADQVKEGERDD